MPSACYALRTMSASGRTDRSFRLIQLLMAQTPPMLNHVPRVWLGLVIALLLIPQIAISEELEFGTFQISFGEGSIVLRSSVQKNLAPIAVFQIEEPARIVVDLPPDLVKRSSNHKVQVGWISSVRVGVHHDKTRLVFDLVSAESELELVAPVLLRDRGSFISLDFARPITPTPEEVESEPILPIFDIAPPLASLRRAAQGSPSAGKSFVSSSVRIEWTLLLLPVILFLFSLPVLFWRREKSSMRDSAPLLRESTIADPYVVLGISPGCAQEVLRGRYRHLAKVFHPDSLQGKNLPQELVSLSTSHFNQIHEAYQKIVSSR
ncbi:MAG: DnaJ domain-containing protein [Bdellovibrionales bacterium]|nr:DnaJ domain-containing protein [Bdellovibrionales bacterium]